MDDIAQPSSGKNKALRGLQEKPSPAATAASLLSSSHAVGPAVE